MNALAQREPASVGALAYDKKLDEQWLRQHFQLRDVERGLEIPYVGLDGKVLRRRIRLWRDSSHPSKWGKPHNSGVYAYIQPASVRIHSDDLNGVEGETDLLTLTWHGLPGIGIPGKGLAKTILSEHLVGKKRIFVVQEQDDIQGTFVDGIAKRLRELEFKGDLRVVDLYKITGAKDVSALHVRNPQAFEEEWARAQELSEPFDLSRIVGHAPSSHEADNPIDDALPIIDITGRELSELTKKAVEALVAKNNPPRIFVRNGVSMRIEHDENGFPICKNLTVEIVRCEMAEVAHWVRSHEEKETGERVGTGTYVPRDVAANALVSPNLPFPTLRGISATPFFTKNGELVTNPGYAPNAQIYLALDPGIRLPSIPMQPTREQIQTIVDALTDLLSDFPFDGQASRANALGLMLEPFARPMIEGPTPLHLFEAPTSRTGKSLLAQVLLLPGCGEVPNSTLSSNKKGEVDEAELRKCITSLLLAGYPAVILDNVKGKIESATLEALLTSQAWRDRALGGNSIITIPNSTIWCATANNATLSTDLVRRTLSIRLDAKMEHPEERTFKRPNIVKYVTEHRGTLAALCLTLLAAWIAAGKPRAAKSLGGFASWAHVVGGTLENAGIPGFLENSERLRESADDEGIAMRMFVQAWHDAYGEKEVSARELALIANRIDGIDLGNGDPANHGKRLGKRLSAMKHRIFGGYQIESRAGRDRQIWFLRPIDGPDMGIAS